MVSVILVAFTLYNSLFCFSYFSSYNNDIKNVFSDGFDAALLQARSSTSANEPVYVSSLIIFNYVYTLFYLKADPLDFQKHSVLSLLMVCITSVIIETTISLRMILN